MQVPRSCLTLLSRTVDDGTKEKLRVVIRDALGGSTVVNFVPELNLNKRGRHAYYASISRDTSEQHPGVTGGVEFPTHTLGTNRREQLEENCQTLGHLRSIIAGVTAQLSCAMG